DVEWVVQICQLLTQFHHFHFLLNALIDLLPEPEQNHLNKTNVEIKKFSTFEDQLSEANKASIILDKIKELVIVKGFLSDKEFEHLIKEGEE
ncbi:hypothetical protein LCGC14_1516230, partial [marine sediment metagenome]